MVRNVLGEGDEISCSRPKPSSCRVRARLHGCDRRALCAAAEYALRAEDDVLAATSTGRKRCACLQSWKIDIYLAFSLHPRGSHAQDSARPEAAVVLHATQPT